MALSQELKEVYASAGPSIILETLELNHHTFPSAFRIVKDHTSWMLGLENSGPTVEFQPFNFSVTEPRTNDKAGHSLKLSIDNVDRQIVDLLEGTQDGTNTPIDVLFRIYLDTETDEPQNDPPLRLSLFNIGVNKMTATGTARRDDIVNRKFPSEVYDSRFISLFVGQ